MNFSVSFRNLNLVQSIAREFPVVIKRALRDTAAQTRTQAKREILQIYNVKSTDVNKALSRPILDAGNLSVKIPASGNPLPAIYFGGQDNRPSGASFQVKKSGKVTELPQGFIPTLPSGHRGIFERVGDKIAPARGRYAGTGIKRQPIKEVFRISIAEMFGSHKIIDKLRAFAYDNMERITISKLKDFIEHGGRS